MNFKEVEYHLSLLKMLSNTFVCEFLLKEDQLDIGRKC